MVEYDRHMTTDIHERHLWLTPQEIAHELRIDVASVYRAVRRGDLPAVRLSHHGALRIHRSVLEPKEDQS
jgi:excisionase family DNA binding protein